MYCFWRPEHINEIYSNPQTAITKPPHIMQRAQWLMGNGLFNDLGGEEWHKKKRMMGPLFLRKVVSDYFSGFDSAISQLLHRLSQFHQNDQNFDLQFEMMRFVADYAFKTFFSTDLGNRLDQITKYNHFTEDMNADVTPFWFPLPKNIAYHRAGRSLQKILLDIIHERRHSKKMMSSRFSWSR